MGHNRMKTSLIAKLKSCGLVAIYEKLLPKMGFYLKAKHGLNKTWDKSKNLVSFWRTKP